MFFRDRLIDEYETHQRNRNYQKDDLDILVIGLNVKRQSWHKQILARIGDALISAGNSMKERDDEFPSTTLSSLTRQRNETIFE